MKLGGKAINRQQWQSNYKLAINSGVIDVQMRMCNYKYWCAKEQKNKNKYGMR